MRSKPFEYGDVPWYLNEKLQETHLKRYWRCPTLYSYMYIYMQSLYMWEYISSPEWHIPVHPIGEDTGHHSAGGHRHHYHPHRGHRLQPQGVGQGERRERQDDSLWQQADCHPRGAPQMELELIKGDSTTHPQNDQDQDTVGYDVMGYSEILGLLESHHSVIYTDGVVWIGTVPAKIPSVRHP